ncbi:unnamed protein product, partial [Iphiclides podalirius]
MAAAYKNFPFEVREIDSAHVVELKDYFEGPFGTCEVRCGHDGYSFIREYEKIATDIYHMEVRPEDTFVLTFPKSGTTWTQELVWLIANDFDYQKALEIPLVVRFPFLESAMFLNSDVMALLSQDSKLQEAAMIIPTVEDITLMPSPRFMKSHIPMSLLPPKLLETCKVVYVARDPRDVAVSFYHHDKLLKSNKDNSDFKTYWNFFTRNLLIYTPHFSHIKKAWDVRDHPNMLFLFYEELSKDLAACARRVAKFLGKRVTDEEINKLCDHLNIKNFKKNKSVNLEDMKELGFLNKKESFIRKGKVGGWRDYFDEEMTIEAERWIKENLQGTDFRFPQTDFLT